MFGFGKSQENIMGKLPFNEQQVKTLIKENLKEFENVVKGMGEDEMIWVSCSVYKIWQMFNVKYKSVENWKKNQDNIVEWISFLDTLAKDNIKKEMAGDLPFGTTGGVWLSYFFFKSVFLNEGAETINAMSDHMEKFNRIGYQIVQEINKT